MYTELIEYFHKGIVSDKIAKIDFAKMNAKAVKYGYIIHPDCCNEAVWNWLDSLTANYNATFYKEWDDILSKNRFELFLDQILHYATTYGTDFSLGNGYVPNDGSIVPSFTNLKVIEPISETDMFQKCVDVLNSGIALKESTTAVLCAFVFYFLKNSNASDGEIIEVLTNIKNKEAQALLSQKFKLMPNDEFGILRCLVHEYTNSFLLIKSREAVKLIKTAAENYEVEAPILRLNESQIKRLSRIFYRFKPLFLAMKTKYTASVVNRMRHLAYSNHTPFKIGFWENIVSTKRPIEEVKNQLEKLDNFRKIRILMLVRERLLFDTKTGIFPIRNGKLYVRENYTPTYDKAWLTMLYFTIRASLAESLSKKACRVKLPKNLNLVLPTSEKTFVGNIPFGSSFKMTKNNIVGVYWRNEWNTNDYDLSMVDLKGRILSWRGSYTSQDGDVIFSGDMTNADPEASELFYIRKTAPDGIIKLNKFRGGDESKFRFFFANEVLDVDRLKNHMVDPNSVKFDTMIEFNGGGEKTIGMFFENEFFFMDFVSGKNRVSSSGKYSEVVIDAMKRKMKSLIGLEDILKDAGFTFVSDDDEDETPPEIDFTNLEKDTFIKLLSSEE